MKPREQWHGFQGKRKGSEANVGQMERAGSIIAGGICLWMGYRSRRSMHGLSLMATGGGMLYRGLTGNCAVYRALDINTNEIDEKGVRVQAAITINRSAEELYAYWRDFENLPRIMSHLESVTELDAERSHWVAKAPAGMHVEWDAEIVHEEENKSITWRSAENAQVVNAGTVRFIPASGERGTEIHITMRYSPPAGSVGLAIAKLFGEEPQRQIEDDLLRFKQFMEAGERPTTQGQPSGRSAKRRLMSNMLSSAISRQEEEDHLTPEAAQLAMSGAGGGKP